METKSTASAQTRANKKYKAKNYWLRLIQFPKSLEPVIREFCEVKGISINSFVVNAVKEKLAREGITDAT